MPGGVVEAAGQPPAAAEGAVPGEGGEVRHWPPLPLEQEDKDGEGVDDRCGTVADGGKKTVC